MRISAFTIVVLSFILITSCQVALDVDIQEQKSKLVLNSIISSDCVIVAYVSKSWDILDTIHYYNPPVEAIVQVSDENGSENILVKTIDRNYRQSYRSNLSPIPGHTYTLKVSADGLESISATAILPGLIENVQVTIDSLHPVGDKLPIEVKFSDRTDQKNYYEAYLIQKVKRLNRSWDSSGQEITYYDTAWYRYKLYYEYIDYSNNKSLLADVYCNGTCTIKSTLDASSYNSTHQILEAKIEVLNISPDYFEYLSTAHLQSETNNDPFSQPVQIFNNIKNGFGIFAGYSRTYVKIK